VDITVSTRGGPPSYPHRKIALAGDRAEVAEELELEGARDVEYHAILESRLRGGHPDLAADTKWTAGWLAQSGDEAILWLQVSASGVSAEDAERAARALRDWCAAAGIRKLEPTDFSRRNRSPDSAEGDWSLR
jgi:hypothetical protein